MLGLDGAEYCAFSPDGGHAMAAGRQGQLEVIDTVTGTTVVGPTSRLRGTVMRHLLAAGGPDPHLEHRRVGTAVRRRERCPAGDRPHTGATLPYGGWRTDALVLTTQGGQVYAWDTSLELRWTRVPGGRSGPDAQEWRLAFPDRPYLAMCPRSEA